MIIPRKPRTGHQPFTSYGAFARGKLRGYARGLHRNPTKHERLMATALHKHFGKHDVEFQIPIVGIERLGYIADYVIRSHKAIIEVDGPNHLRPRQLAYDIERSNELNAMGWIVLRVWNDDVEMSPDVCADGIKRTLHAYRKMDDQGVSTALVRVAVHQLRMPGPVALQEHKPIRKLKSREPRAKLRWS